MPNAIITAIMFVGNLVMTALPIIEVVFGISGTTFFVTGALAITAGVVGMSKLMEMSLPRPDSNYARQKTVRSTTAPVKRVYGESLISGPVAFMGVGGTGNQDLWHVIALTGDKSEAITDIYLDNIIIPNADIDSGNSAGGIVNGTTTIFKPIASTTLVTVYKYTGGQTAASMPVVSEFFKWTSDHEGQGLTYIATKFSFPDNEKIAEIWNKYNPQDIKALVKGMAIYDPRKDSTSPEYDSSLGVSTQRLSDSTTWQWSDNPALCLANYIADDQFGMGVPSSAIDWAAVHSSADYADALVSIPGSQTQKRFTCNGVLYGTDSHAQNINKILSSMNGSLVYSSGKYVMQAGQYIEPESDAILTDNDLNGPINITVANTRDDRFNTIKGTHFNPQDLHKKVAFPEVQLTDIATRDAGEVLYKEVELPMTNDVYMCQRLTYQMINRSNDQLLIEFPCNLKALRYTVGDRVKITLDKFAGSDQDSISFNQTPFVILGFNFSAEGAVTLTMLKDTQANYTDMPAANYSTIASDGSITDGFSGVPAPTNLSSVVDGHFVRLTWDNPVPNTTFNDIIVYQSSTSNFSESSILLRTKNDAITFSLPSSALTKYYWVRASLYDNEVAATDIIIGQTYRIRSLGTTSWTTLGATAPVSNGDTFLATASGTSSSGTGVATDESAVSAVAGPETVTTTDQVADSVEWIDVDDSNSLRPSNNATVGATLGTDVYDGQAQAYAVGDLLNSNGFFRFTRTSADDNVDAPANAAAFNTAFGRAPTDGDIVVVTNTTSSPNKQAAYQYDGSTFGTISGFFAGDLIIDDTITAAALSVDELGAITADLGTITGGTLKGGTIPDADAAPSGTESGSFFDLTGGKFVVGNATNNLLFDSSALTVTGTVNASAGEFTGSVSIGSTGAIYGGTMDEFLKANTSGFFLGYDTDAYKLSVGNSSGEVLTWDGSKLNVEANTVSFSTGGEQDYSSESRYTTSQKSATVVLADDSSYFLFDNRRQDLAFPDFIVSYYLGPLTSGTQSSAANALNGIMENIKVELFYADASTGSPGTWTSLVSVDATSWDVTSGPPFPGLVYSNFRVKESGTYVASLDTRNDILDDYPTISPFGDALDGTSVPVGLVDNDYFINIPLSKNTFVFPKGRYFVKVVITVTDGSLSPYPATGSPTATVRRISIPNASSFVHPDFGQSVFVGGAHTTIFTDNNRDNETLIKGGSVYLMSKEGANADDNDSTAIFFGGRGTTGGTPNVNYGPLHGLYFFNDRDAIGSGNGILGSIGSPQFKIEVPYDGSKLTFGGDANFTDGLYINGVAVNAGAVTGPAGSNTQVQFNNSGSLGASTDFTFNDSTDTLTVKNLTVSGTTTTVNVADLNVADKDITLNYSTGDSSSTANNAGIIIQDAVDASTDASILWKTASDTFEFSHGISSGDLTCGNITATGVGTTPFSLTGTGSILYLNIGSATQTEYTGMQYTTDDGNAQFWKTGSNYTGWGGADAFNVYNSNGNISFHPSGTANVLQVASSGITAIRDIALNNNSTYASLTLAGGQTGGVSYALHNAIPGVANGGFSIRRAGSVNTLAFDTSDNATFAGAISSGALTSTGNSSHGGYSSWTAGSGTGGIFMHYNATNSYRGYFDWRTLQLGNNGANNILAGNTEAGGYFNFWVNATAISQAGGTSGIKALTLTAAGNTIARGTLSSGDITIEVDDTPTLNFKKASSADVLASINVTTDTGSGGKLVIQTKRDGNTAVDRLTIDDAGNAGLGVVPEAWHSTYDVLQIGSGGSLAASTTNESRVFLQANTYINTSNVASYLSTDEASRYWQNGGTHIFNVAPSGTADAAISWTTAMTIDNAGSVGIGRSSADTVLHVNASAGTTYPALGTASGVIGASIAELHGMYLGVDGSSGNGWIQAMREDGTATAYDLVLQPSGGNVLIGKTTQAFGTAGIEFKDTNVANFTRDNATPINVNRLGTNDGTLIILHKAGVNIGAIGVSGGNNLFISGNAASHGGLTFATQSVLPTTEGTINNALVSLGQNGNAFKDLFLTGSVVGGAINASSGLYNSAGSDSGSQQAFWAASSGVTYQAGYQINWNTGGNNARTTKMLLTSSGNLLIGKTTTALATAGVTLGGSGFASLTRSGAEPLNVNRLSSDGDLAVFYKDSVAVGSVGVSGGNNTYISGSAASHSGLVFATNEILPTNAGGAGTDGLESLGGSSNRFKDLHLSGAITASNLTLTDDGVAGGIPLLKISADDSSPWALQLYREDLLGGPQMYASDASTFSLSGNLDLRASFSLKMNGSTVIDASRNATFAKQTINATIAPNGNAWLNIGSTGSGETRAIDIDGGWSTGESKAISFTHGTTVTSLVGQIKAAYNNPGSSLEFGRLYHNGDSSFYPLQLNSTSTTSADLNLSGNFKISGTTVIDASRNLTNISSNNHQITTYNDRSIKIKTGGAGSSGITLTDGSDAFRLQLYADGSSYGFLDSVWGSWDIKKITNGRMHLNGNETYYIQPESTSNFNAVQAHNIIARAANVIIDAQSSADGQTVGFRAGYLGSATLAGYFKYTTGDAQLYIDNAYQGNNALYSTINFRNCPNGSTSPTTRLKIHGSSGNVDVTGGSFQMGTTTVIDSSRNITAASGNFSSIVGINKATTAVVALSVGSDASTTGSYGLEVCNATSNTRLLVDGVGNTSFYGSNNAITARFTSGNLFQMGGTTVIDASRNITGTTIEATSKLYLNRGNYEGQIIFGAASTWRVGISQYDNSDAEMRIWARNANGRVHIVTDFNGEIETDKPADGLVVDHNNVGIGNFSTTDPTEKLHVKGNILASGNVTAYSDERLKSDIQTLDGKKVLQMRGVSFTKDGVAGSGVIAQELELVASELVSDGEYKSVAYGNITGYLIEAIKDQQSEIDELKTLVKKLMEK